MTKTPKTDSQAYDVFYRGDMGGKFTATETKMDKYGDYVSVDFARQLEEALANLLANPYPHDLMAIRIEVEREWGGDEEVAQEEMDAYCTQEYMLEAREKWKSAENAARKLLNL
jgi:hypothetical protein